MLAIVIPYFKFEFFEILLKSLDSQVNKAFKVYIGNDASPYNPEKLLNEYKHKIDITYKKFDTNFGGQSLVKQWERCLELVQDEKWIMILGDDDYLEPNVVESFYNNYSTFNNKSHLIRFATKTHFIEKSIVTDPVIHPKWEKAEDSFYRKFKGKTRSSLSEYIFAMDIYNKLKFTEYPLAWHSDDKAWLDFSYGLPIYTINEAVVVISVSNQSITGVSNNLNLKIKAQKLFYYSLLKNKGYNFSNDAFIDILRAFEFVSVRINAFCFKDWILVNTIYLKKLKLRSLFHFYKRSMGRLIKK